MPTDDHATDRSTGHDDCHDCALARAASHNRRDFLGAAGYAGLALFGLGGAPGGARALAIAPLRQSSADSKVYPIPDTDGVQIDKDSGVILVRWLGSVYAFSLRCPHQNTALRWLDKDEHFQCPKHRSEYAADGYFITGRATRGMDRYAITRDDKTVVVDLNTLYKQNDDAKAWEAAAVKL